MLRSAGAVASRAAAGIALVATCYLAVALWRVRAFSRRRGESSDFLPSVSLLKPLCGSDPALEANLLSFCRQDYPDFQVVFSAVDQADPAVGIARRVAELCAGADIEVVVAPAAAGVPNPKIANAQNGERRARGDLIVMADADMRVDPAYLRAIAAPLADGGVGAVTCVYGGVAGAGGIVPALAAMFINDHFAPSVLVANAIEPLAYCFGSTMAVRRSVLGEIGGLAALGTTIADDYSLGKLVTASGRRVVLPRYVVHSMQNEVSFRALWSRELRWARTIRSVRPVGSTLAVVTFGLPLAAVAWLCRPRSPRRIGLLALSALLRLALHRAARDTFAPQTPLTPHLVPLRDAVALAVWAAGRFGGTVEWRTETLAVGGDGNAQPTT